MVVDDTEFNLYTMRVNIKEHYQLTITEAENGQIAVDKFKEALDKPCKCENRAFQLIYMDIQMPILDGIKATEKILELIKSIDPSKPISPCTILAVTACTTD